MQYQHDLYPNPKLFLFTNISIPLVNSPLPSGMTLTFFISWSCVHLFITKESLTLIQYISSIPFSLKSLYNFSKLGN